MIWAWIETSRALIGSSATMRSGFERERPGDADALALAAGELVRVALGVVGVEPDRRQQLADALAALGLGADAVDVERLADDAAGRHPRVEAARTGPGRSSASAGAARAARLPSSRRDVLCRRTSIRPVGRLVQADDRPAGRGLAAARLADEPERLAAARCSNVTPSTARTSPMWRSRMIPSVIGNQTLRSSTRSSGAAAPASRRAGAPAVAAVVMAIRSPPSWPRAASAGRRPIGAIAESDRRRRSRRRLARRRSSSSSAPSPSSSTSPGGGAATNPSRSGRPADGLLGGRRVVAGDPVGGVRAGRDDRRAGDDAAASAGLSVQHASRRHAQRGANGQPSGAWRWSGGRPSIGMSGSAARVVEARDRVQQPDRVRVRRRREQLAGRRGLDDEARRT